MFEYKTQPRAHQRAALRKGARKTNFALLQDPGTGKSFVGLCTAAYHYQNGAIDQLVVLAPNGVHDIWVEEQASAHCPGAWIGEVYHAGRSTRSLEKMLAEPRARGMKILALNTEMLSTEEGLNRARGWIGTRPTLLAIDESQYIKTPSAKRTRRAWALGRHPSVQYRRILTGTPLTKGYEDLYAQFRFLDPEIIGCRTFAEFKTQYCVEWGEFRKIVGYRNLPQLFARIEPYTFQVKLQDCYDLPERVVMPPVRVELSPEQRRVYNELKTEFLTQLDSGQELEAVHQLARITRLQQIVAGHVGVEDGEWVPLPCPRLEKTVELVEQSPGQVLVWCTWKPDVIQLLDALSRAGIACAGYYGDQSNEENKHTIERFRAGQIKAFVGTRSKGARGQTLNEATTTINYSHSHNYEHHEQSDHRNYRDGQTQRTVVFDLVTPGTTDVTVRANVARKGNLADTLGSRDKFRAILEGNVQ